MRELHNKNELCELETPWEDLLGWEAIHVKQEKYPHLEDIPPTD